MKLEDTFGILVIINIAFLVIVNYKGFAYDTYKEEIDKKYKNNHSIDWKYGKFWLAIPRIITENSENKKIQIKKKEYNRASISFWISVMISTIIYFTSGMN